MVDGFILTANETCENRLLHSWTLIDVSDFSHKIGRLCQIDEIVNELATHNLSSKIVHIVRKILLSSLNIINNNPNFSGKPLH